MTDAVLQVFLLVLVGVLTAAVGWIQEDSARSFSEFVFRVFMPPLLFRAMATVDLSILSLQPIVAYLGTASLLYLAVYFMAGRFGPALFPRSSSEPGHRAAVALAIVFSNNVMVGIPVVKIFFGPEGLAILLSVISVHALVLLGMGTVGFELARRPAGGPAGQGAHASVFRWAVLGPVLKKSVLSPVVVPIFLGLAWNALALPMPLLLDSVLAVLGQAGVPACLVLLGATLYLDRNRIEPKSVGPIVLGKLVVFPVLVYGVAQHLLGLSPLQVAILTTMACLPTGANTYLLSQGYGMGVSLTATGVAATTALSAFTLPYVLSLFASP